MKSDLEIEQLSRSTLKTIDSVACLTTTDDEENIFHQGFHSGYKQCEKDISKEIYEFGLLVLDTFHSEGKTHSGQDRLSRIKFDEWFNQLNE